MEPKTKILGLFTLIGLFLLVAVALSGCIGGCGDLNQNCCKGEVCNAGYSCGPDEKCHECGNISELCCAGNTCNEGVCSNGKCEKCGNFGELCCAGNTCNEGVCSNGKCEKCGNFGELCCAGNTCNEGVCSNGKCEKCGNFGELCCAGNTCNEGVCSNGKCEKRSAKEDIDKAVSLMNSAKERIDKLPKEKIYETPYTDIKNKLALSKTDYEEAIKILENAKTDYDSERKIIEINKIICNASLDYIDASQSFVIGMEHIEKWMAYITTLNIEGIKKSKYELKLSEKNFNDSMSFTLKAKNKINKINISDIPPEFKSRVQEIKQTIEDNEKNIYEFKKMLSGMYPYLDGLEHVHKAYDYAKNEKWHLAEVEYKESLLDFSKSKDIFEDLRDSKVTEVSSAAILIYGYIETYMDAISHMELASKYMDEGKKRLADEEFKKALEDLTKLYYMQSFSEY